MTPALLLVAALAGPVPIVPMPDVTSMSRGQYVTCESDGGCIAMTKAVMRAVMADLEARAKACTRKGNL